ncbi:MAG: DMT family transporter [Cyanobacteria bacterium SBLK]|nr:DMT family transporter [Cyanobacteria bacterium SBLK]
MKIEFNLFNKSLSLNTKNVALAASIIAALLLALMPIFVRFSETGIGANATIFNRFLMVSLSLILWECIAIANKAIEGGSKCETKSIFINPSFLKDALLPLSILIVAFFSTQFLWTWSLSQTTVANSQVLHCLSPAFATLAGWILFSQKFGAKFLVGMTLATIGTLGVGLSDITSHMSIQGDCLALLSALFWAGYIMAIERLRSIWDSTTILFFASVSCGLLSLPILLSTGDSILPNTLNAWLAIVLLVANTLGCHLLMAYSLKWLSSALVATVLLLNPILAALIGWVLFSESLSILNLLGFSVIIIGVYYAISGQMRMETQEQ